nr:MerR family transcriptional regulator [uncultured Sellimonas sp.]
MRKYVLTISELAKLRNTTSETLRHYDRIGLLKPVYVSDGGHRYYSIRQYEKLGTILELKEIGMTLGEIKEYFDNRNLRKSYEMLKSYQERFEKHLEEQIRINEIMLKKLEFVRGLFSLPEMERIFEKEFPVRHMITLGRESGDREEHAMAFTKLEGSLEEKIPILATDRMGVFADQRILIPSDEMIPAVPMVLVDPEKEGSKYVREIQAGKYVCMMYKNGLLEKYHPSFEKIKQYLYQKHYRICGPILQVYIVDATLTNEEEEKVLEIQVPVEE